MRSLLLAIAATSALATPAAAQSYPARTIRMVVPYPAGGTSDVLARVLARKMGDGLGQTMVIENIGGAAGTIGAAAVARAAPDGHTLLFAYATQLTIAPAIYQSLTYDPIRSFAPIGSVVRFHFLMTAHSSQPFDTLPGLVRHAKAHPGKLTYASPGVGTSTHLVGELFKLAQGIDLVHVPYRGGGPAITDYVAGRVDVYWDAIAPLKPWVEKSTIKPLAVTSAQRMPGLPQVPTVIEAGMPDLNVFTWTALLAPAGTPGEATARLEGEMARALEDREVRETFERNGYELFPGSPTATLDLIRSDLARWQAVVKATGLKAE